MNSKLLPGFVEGFKRCTGSATTLHAFRITVLLAFCASAAAQTTGKDPLTIDRTTKRVNEAVVKIPNGSALTFERGSALTLPAPLLPSDIASLAMWWKADAITGKVDGDTVSTWSDSSGNGRTATAAGTPIYKTNVLNGLPAVRFDHASYLATASLLDSTWDQNITIVALIAPNGLGYNYCGSVGANYLALSHAVKNGNYTLGAAGSAYPANAMPDLQPRVDVVSYDGANILVRNQGQALEPQAAATANMGLTGPFYVGVANLGSFDFNGDIMELMVFKRALTLAEKLQMEAYLRAKWAVLNKPRIVFAGDSIINGAGSSSYNPAWRAMEKLSSGYQYDASALGHGGTGIGDYGPIFGSLIDGDIRAGEDMTVVLELVVNDLRAGISAASEWAAIKAWCLARKAAGAKRILIHTCTPDTSGTQTGGQGAFDTARAAYRALVLAHYAECSEGVVDIGGNSTIGDPTDSDDSTYYQSDKLHPKDAGLEIMGGIQADALLRAYAQTSAAKLLSLTPSGITFTSGAGSPESVVTAPAGSLFLRTDGSTSTTLYVKTSGAGNTGWTAK